jgi:hypothetical protein
MKPFHLLISYFLINTVLPGLSNANALQKRDSGDMSCYNAGNIVGFSALCPSINYPIINDRGLNVFEVLFFAMKSTNLPPNTTYNAQENIICTTKTPGPNITITLGADIGVSGASVGAQMTFSFTTGPPDNGGKRHWQLNSHSVLLTPGRHLRIHRRSQ